jgi:hypothetical protein
MLSQKRDILIFNRVKASNGVSFNSFSHPEGGYGLKVFENRVSEYLDVTCRRKHETNGN